MYVVVSMDVYAHKCFNDKVINTGVFTFKVTYADLQEFLAPTGNEQKSAATFDTTTAYAELLM